MTLKLFELVGTDEARPFSPFCWRTRMALAHKGLSAETIPWCFTEKEAIAPHGSEKVPVLLDGDMSVVDFWTIANYLEDNIRTGRRCSAARAAARSADAELVGRRRRDRRHISAHHRRHPVGPEAGRCRLFPETREARFGKPLEEIMAGRDKAVEGFRKSIDHCG